MKSIDTSLLSSLCEGLVGYATYESRAGLGAAMSEVVFYMPVLRIAKHLEWKSRVEFGLPSSEHRAGDRLRVDFVFERTTKSAGRHGLRNCLILNTRNAMKPTKSSFRWQSDWAMKSLSSSTSPSHLVTVY